MGQEQQAELVMPKSAPGHLQLIFALLQYSKRRYAVSVINSGYCICLFVCMCVCMYVYVCMHTCTSSHLCSYVTKVLVA